MRRQIVVIDEDRCDGCGLCVPACAEGALQIVNGKARLVSDRLCDGLGACLGHCPRGAIRIELREAAPFDQAAVQARLAAAADGLRVTASTNRGQQVGAGPSGLAIDQAGGCPGSRFARFDSGAGVFGAARTAEGSDRPGQPSALTHWPVQLRLLPVGAPVLRAGRWLVAADCVPVACADFHATLLPGRAVMIACPKLDRPNGCALPAQPGASNPSAHAADVAYVDKLAEMIRRNDPAEITVARMEVPCCAGILRMVLQARRQVSSRVPVEEVVVGIRGQVIGRQWLKAEGAVLEST